MDEPEFDEPEEPFDSFAPGPEDEPLFDAPAPAPSPTASTAPAPLALYRRYRPDTFADVIGQEHVTEPLQRALTNNRVNHAYLFSGPRGCGKTTSARILARALNCELGPRAEPCGECQSCRDLARGGPGSIDVIEIDAASHGGVDDARDLRERAFFAPVASRYKIYIVDEAHMVTTAGFNALLKLVEEPPPHVKFIFATTEPDKVIGTIRSRTHHYPFRLVPPRVLSDYLAKLCAAEGIAVESVVLPLVVRAGAGSVRDSLSVLDQLLGGAEESGVSYSQATSLLGYTPDSLLDEFMDAFAAGDAGGVFACVDKVIEVGQDPRRFAEDLLRRLRDLVIVAAVSDALTSGLVEVAPDQADRLSSQAAALGAGELTRAAEVMAAGLTDMRGTTAPRLHLELMCARVLLPGADVDGRGIHARLDRLERRAGMTGTAAAARPEPPTTLPEPVEGSLAPRTPEPTNTRPEPTTTRPEPTTARPEPTTARPEPTTARPEPTTTLPEPVEGPPQPTSAPEPNPTPEPTAAADRPGQAPTSRPSPAKQAEHRQAQDRQAPDRQGPAGGESDDTALGSTPDKDAGSPMSVVDVRRLWPEVLEEVKGKRRFTWILLSQNAQVAEVRNGNLLLSMANVGARDSFSRGGSEDVLKEALIVVLGVDFKIETIVEGGGTGSPAPARPGPVSDDAARSWNNPAPAPAEAPAPPAPASAAPADQPPTDPRVREQARQSIRPTRQGQSVSSANDERDSAATLNDSDLEESTESHTELLARHLGAEIIAEEEHGA